MFFTTWTSLKYGNLGYWVNETLYARPGLWYSLLFLSVEPTSTRGIQGCCCNGSYQALFRDGRLQVDTYQVHFSAFVTCLFTLFFLRAFNCNVSASFFLLSFCPHFFHGCYFKNLIQLCEIVAFVDVFLPISVKGTSFERTVHPQCLNVVPPKRE